MVNTQKILDCLLYFKGSFLRNELCNILSISPASATREIKKYRELHGDNIKYDVSNKCYVATKDFSPKYPHDTNLSLSLIYENKLVVNVPGEMLGISDNLPSQLPNQELAARLSRACSLKQNLTTTYLSVSSKNIFRAIRPQKIFRIGNLWYVRAVSKELNKKAKFRIFKLVRFLNLKLSSDELDIDIDHEWETSINLTLSPHKKHPHQDSLRLDLGIHEKPVINVKTNKVLAGYILQELNVDCSVDASLDPIIYQFQLMNRHELQGVSSMVLAPGFGHQNNTV